MHVIHVESDSCSTRACTRHARVPPKYTKFRKCQNLLPGAVLEYGRMCVLVDLDNSPAGQKTHTYISEKGHPTECTLEYSHVCVRYSSTVGQQVFLEEFFPPRRKVK